MAEAVLMPKSGISVESCIVGAWRKQVGDPVSIGDILFDYETDKATFECESTAEGTLLAVFYETGSEVEVLKPVCAIGREGEDVSALQTLAGGGEDGSVTSVLAEQISDSDSGGGDRTDRQDSSDRGGRDRSDPKGSSDEARSESDLRARRADSEGMGISPRARHLSEKLGVSPFDASPTGPRGRVIARDIERLYAERRSERPAAEAAGPGASAAAEPLSAAAPLSGAGATAAASSPSKSSVQVSASGGPPMAAPAGTAPEAMAAISPTGSSDGQAGGPEYTDGVMPRIRRVIATNMAASLQTLAQLTHHHAFDASQLMKLRRAFKEHGAARGLDGISIGDMILFAVSRTLLDFPYMNSLLLDGDVVRTYRDVHLGVAVDTPRGLMVPVIFSANRKSLRQISDEVKSLALAAREGNINPDLLQGATFTVSNLGPTGVEIFTPIINPPQVGILGVCGSTTRVKRGAEGLVAYPSIGLSLTYDHRAVDGAPASRFAGQLAKNLEAFLLLLADR